MNQREKILAIIAGGLVAVVAVAFIGLRVSRSLAALDARLRKATTDLENSEMQITLGREAADQLQAIAERALPAQREVASTAYQQWLVTLAEQQLDRVNVTRGSVTPNKDIFEVHSFKVTGIGNLREVTRLLSQLESANLAHRIQQLSLRPIKDKKDIDVNLVLEVLAMPQAPERNELPPPPADAPEQRRLEQIVLDRNLFAPRNREPQLEVDEVYTAFVGQPFRLEPSASDPDRLDNVDFEADVSGLPNARFSRSNKTIQWTPRELGEYKITIAALDDGIPQRRVEREVRIRVQPAPQAPPPREEKVDLTAAKFAYVTGVTRSGGRPEVWVSLRTEGKTLKLGVGDSFKLGNIEASVASIESQNVEIDAAGRRVRVRLGQSLAESGLQ